MSLFVWYIDLTLYSQRDRKSVLPCKGNSLVRNFIKSELRESPLGRKLQHLRLLTKLEVMKKNFRQVSPEDFDVEKLLAAAREGRLYVEEHERGVSEEEIKKEVRAYVARVKVFVTKDFRQSADALWEQLLACDELFELMKPSPKARLCRTFNKYNVVSMIGVLREKGVYEPYSNRKFDALLEPDVAESPYRRYLGAGIEKYALLVKIRQIVGQFRL